jgi:hypothetical protein
MAKTDNRKSFPFSRPGNYRIRVLGSLDESWSKKLGSFRITTGSLKDQERSVTELVGRVRDQAELAGILETLYELHLQILLVEYQDE